MFSVKKNKKAKTKCEYCGFTFEYKRVSSKGFLESVKCPDCNKTLVKS